MKIPTVDLPSVDSRPLGTPFQQFDTRGAFGGGEGMRAIANGLGEVSKELQAHEKQKKEETDVAAIAAAEAALDQHVNATLYDPEKGYLTKKGANALGTRPAVLETIGEKAKALEEMLSNEDQKRLFRMRAYGTLSSSSRTVDTHARNQGELLKAEAFKTMGSTTVATVTLNYNDAEEYRRQMATLEAYGVIEAQRQGMDPTSRGELLRALRGSLAEGRLRGYLAHHDGSGARSFFEEAREDLGTSATKYEHAVREAGLDEEAEKTVNALAAVTTGANGRLDSPKFLAAIEHLGTKGAAPDFMAKLRGLATHRATAADHGWAQQSRDVFNRASSAYERRHSLSDVDPADAVWLKSQDNGAVHLWQALEDRARADSDYWRVLGSRPAKETPAQRLSEFELRADMVDHPEKYLGMTPGEFATLARPKLSPQGFEAVGQAFNAMRATVNKADPNANLPASVEETVLTLGREAKIFPSKGTKTIKLGDPSTWGDAKTPAGNAAADVYLAVTGKLRKAAAEYRAANGKPPPADYMQGLAAKELARVRVTQKGIIWDSEKETAAADAALAGMPSRPIIPKAEEDQIRAALKAQGLEETEENIARLYRAAHASVQKPSISPDEALVSLVPENDPLAPLVP